MRRWVLIAGIGMAVALGGVRPAAAGPAADAGMGVATVLANSLYMPAKLAYVVFGGLTGGIAYAVTAGNLDIAQQVWSAACGGTYALTPEMLRGDEPVYFSGPQDVG